MKKKESYNLKRILIFDFYYNKRFIKNFLLFFVLFVVVYFFSLFLTQVPSLLKRSNYNEFITIPHILKYYAYLIPKFINDTILFSFLFSVSYSLGNFYAHNEALVLIASGVPIRRIGASNLFMAFFLGIFLFIANTTFFPFLLTKAESFAKKLGINFNIQNSSTSNILQDTNGLYYFSRTLDDKKKELVDFLVLKPTNTICDKKKSEDEINFNEFANLTVKQKKELLLTQKDDSITCFGFTYGIRGKNLQYNTQRKIWVAYNGVIYNFSNSHKVSYFTQKDLPSLTLDFHYLTPIKEDIDTMTITQALEYKNNLVSHREPTQKFMLEFLDSKFLKFFSFIYLTFFATVLGRFFSRKHIIIYGLLFSFTVTFAFLILVNIGYSLVKSNVLPLFFGSIFGYLIGAFIIYFLAKRQKS